MSNHDEQLPEDGPVTVHLPNGRPVVVQLTPRKRNALLTQLDQGLVTLDPPGDDAA